MKKLKKLNKKLLLLFLTVIFLISCKSVTTNDEVGTNNTEFVKTNIRTATDSLENIRKKIKDAKNNLKLKYSKKREDFESDIIFANFRNVQVGNLKQNILYRGASPIDNSFNRAKYADELIKNTKIKYDVDLSDDRKKVEKSLKKKEFESEYFLSLFNENKVSLLHMTTDFKDEKNYYKSVQGLIDMSKNDGPYYVHCVEGKHRTGFFCMLVEALAGATYDEMVDDFMLTFYNYYGITKENNKEAYDIIKAYYIDDMLMTMAGINDYSVDLSTYDFANIAKNFLMKYGMTEVDLDNWYKKMIN